MSNNTIGFLARKMQTARVESYKDQSRMGSTTIAIVFDCSDIDFRDAFPGDVDGRMLRVAVSQASAILTEVAASGMGHGDITELSGVVTALKTIGKALR